MNHKDDLGETPLYCATEQENIEMVKYLLEQGADVNIKDYTLETPLQCAVRKRNKKIVELLVNNSADVNYEAEGGENSVIGCMY